MEASQTKTVAPASGRFASLNDEEFDTIIRNKDSEATLKSTKKSVNILRSYLREKGLPLDFEASSKAELNLILKKFYVELRKADGDYYKTASITSIRAGICRHLKDGGKSGVDILKDTEFAEANVSFKAALVQLKQIGKGDTQHHSDIDENDISRAYSSGVLSDENPYALQRKVWFELMLYICRRGRENLRNLGKDHFAVATDSDGRKYVYQAKDEMTKKVREDNTSSNVDGSRMYATETDGCPVASFEKYVSKLNPECDAFFQTPKATVPEDDEAPWYKNGPVGLNTLGKMMSILSKAAGLSKAYTNHCLRATCISILDRNGFANRYICSVSGHQNEASISSYVGRVSDNKKQKMSHAISSAVMGKKCLSLGAATSSSPGMPESLDAEPGHSRPTSEHVTEISCIDPVISDSQLALLEPEMIDMLAAADYQEQDLGPGLGMTVTNSESTVTITACARPPPTTVKMSSKNTMQSLQQQPMILNNCQVTINYNFNSSQ